MKDIIIDRLNKMEDLEQRKILKNIMVGVFENLVNYEEKMYKNLENRVFSEIEDVEEKYDVYISLTNRKKVDPIDEFLHPIFKEDIEEKKYDIKEIFEKLKNDHKVNLFTIFMNCDYKKIKKLAENEKIYNGEIVTNKKTYRIQIKLKQNRKYINEIEKLYYTFQKNSIPWKTINNPYANKFFDIILINCENITDEEEIKEISFDLEEFEKYKMIDMILLWNIESLKIKSIGFPVPAEDKVNFEHEISLKKIGKNNGCLFQVQDEVIRYIKRTLEKVIIVSPKESFDEWEVLKIIQPKEEENYGHEVVSNSRNNSFINKFAKKQASIIRTKGEIKRIINSFETSKYFQLEAVEIKDEKYEAETTYDMNFFIADDIRIGMDKKVMILKFKVIIERSYIFYDIMSFLVSEIQMYFPEYKCEGELV